MDMRSFRDKEVFKCVYIYIYIYFFFLYKFQTKQEIFYGGIRKLTNGQKT
jgi:hypothetical protein